jgi:micrococcal nuclease
VRWAIPGDARRSRVVRVVDGDTLILRGVGRTRLIGLDTPEVFGERECYGRAASAFAKRLLPPGRRVRYEWGVERRDRYGRALVTLWLRDGRSVNGMLVAGGYATTLTIPPNTTYEQRLEALQDRARRARRGLWRACDVTPAQGAAGPQ